MYNDVFTGEQMPSWFVQTDEHSVKAKRGTLNAERNKKPLEGFQGLVKWEYIFS